MIDCRASLKLKKTLDFLHLYGILVLGSDRIIQTAAVVPFQST